MKDNKKEKHLKDDKLRLKMKYDENRSRVPIKNMIYKDDPPAFVSIVGPKRSGKSTLVKSLVKKFTGQTLSSTDGPITITLGKEKRITFFEVKNDIHQFVDASKVSDLVIFTIDASLGLEMETFEFLMLLISHGMPKLMFVITNVDKKNDKSYLKQIKKRIWSEITEGLKFFHLSINKSGKRYDGMEFLNLCRALSVMKYRPIEWKCSHPHIVVDKMLNGHLYGYVRGACFKTNTYVHIPGYKDMKITDLEILDDPVPVNDENKLSNKRKILYAPLSSLYSENKETIESDVEFEFEDDEDIKLFKKSEQVLDVECSSSDEDESTDKSDVDEVDKNGAITESYESEDCQSFDDLKASIKDKFIKKDLTEEELIEKFDEKYKDNEDESVEDNFLLQEKKKLEILKEKNKHLKMTGLAYPGEYVKVKLNENIHLLPDKSKLLILGSMLIGEDTKTFLQGQIKTTKWHNKPLKTNEPVLFSVGWHRFQSIPVFSMKNTDRNRMLKYTTKGMFCNINFYGPVVTPGSGICIYSERFNFRIIGIGTVQDVTGDHSLVKKLKLVGYPKKIQHNTAFIKDMFTSDLEVIKFKNAKLNTVSGIKGIIKGPLGKNGDFRGLFDNPIIMSDIVFLKCFVPFPLYDVFITVTDLYDSWKGLRPLKDIRDEMGIQVEDKYIEEVSDDQDVDLPKRAIKKDYKLPKEIEANLPFDCRDIKVVDKRINLPIPPEELETRSMEANILRMREEREKAEKTREEMEKKMKYKMIQEQENLKSLGVKKSILDNKNKYKFRTKRSKR